MYEYVHEWAILCPSQNALWDLFQDKHIINDDFGWNIHKKIHDYWNIFFIRQILSL